MSAELVLRLRNLRKGFDVPEGGRIEVLDIDGFEIARGEHVALRGESGSGKTTLLHVIAGLLAADAGEVVVAGGDVARLGEGERDAWRARHVGYVFQSFNLLQGFTALENVALAGMFGGGADVERARGLLERVGLRERLEFLPRRLSIGQQQRVAIARALVNSPTLVLADEPTGNLDRSRANEALGLMRELCRESGAALLLVSHDDRVLANFERVVDLAALNRAATVR